MKAQTEAIRISRRDILAGAATAGAFMLVPRHVLGRSGQSAPSDRINVACVGAGGQATWNIAELEKAGAHIGFLCDVDLKRAEAMFAKYPQAPRVPTLRVSAVPRGCRPKDAASGVRLFQESSGGRLQPVPT